MHIALDARLTPPQNAQKYYQAYKKACTAEKLLTEQIAKGREELTYLDSVLDALSRAETENDLEQKEDKNLPSFIQAVAGPVVAVMMYVI